MTQRLRALAAFAEDPGSIFSAHMVAGSIICRSSSQGSGILFWLVCPAPDTYMVHRYSCKQILMCVKLKSKQTAVRETGS